MSQQASSEQSLYRLPNKLHIIHIIRQQHVETLIWQKKSQSAKLKATYDRTYETVPWANRRRDRGRFRGKNEKWERAQDGELATLCACFPSDTRKMHVHRRVSGWVCEVSYLRGHWEKREAQKLAALHVKVCTWWPRRGHLLNPWYIKHSQYIKSIYRPPLLQ